ncbi:MAG TPA: hypothetical protein VFW71_11585 [Actinomycetota bacterium]|nr:hypothetical protein [Actinomycetota bacterium]
MAVVVVLVGGGIVLADVVSTGTKAGGPSAGAQASSVASTGQGGASAAAPRVGTTTIAALTSPVSKGGTETVRGLAAPGAQCTLAVTGQGKSITPPGLQLAMRTDAKGQATWTWTIDASYASGNYELKLACSPGTTSTSSFTVP